MAEVSLSRICSFVTFASGMLMIVIGLYVFIMSSFGAVFVTGENIFGGLITIICGGVALVGWNKIGGMIWPMLLIVAGAVGGGAGGIVVIIGGLLAIAAEVQN